ncbi:MAG: acyl-ACP--UDP-N-acetylglucosamine O-acyltransferase [Francisellaceae bacterium]|jgi:UDP-N-acetylglucosamine acyltransferase|nr:acyl-ACP--UDP-N-acetylglucosamine O-acyltransferase [Francisellaceae bacterium]MBT6539540.1 acyl-ACP--UDP-N-acetylglucosamine O-acyltransferase [Francisellaceae bacterium]
MISELAQVHPSAKIGKNVEIGPFTLIGEDVEISDNVWVGSHAVIKGPTKIGSGNKIYQFSSIGEGCQDKKYNNERTTLLIGENNTFREGCIIHRGTVQGGGTTVIGNNNLFMTNTHVAHDCLIEDNVIFSAGASIAGHVKVCRNANLGGFVGVHQFCTIGEYSFCAGGAMITQDVMPFVMVSGHPPQTFGLNVVGMERNNFNKDVIDSVKKAYKIIFRSSYTVKELEEVMHDLISKYDEVTTMHEFLLSSKRGIVR